MLVGVSQPAAGGIECCFECASRTHVGLKRKIN